MYVHESVSCSVVCLSSQQVVYSASHIDTIPDSLVSSVASSSSTTAQLTQSTASTSGPIAMPSVVDVAGGGGTGGLGHAIIPNSILGQNEAVTQIQGAMADLQGQLMSGAGATIESGVLAENAQQGSAALIPGQTTTTVSAGIQDSIMTQAGVVGGDSIQDSIQDSIMGQAGPGAIAAAALLGQVGGGKTTGIQDSSQFLNPAASTAVPGNLMSGGGASSGGGGEGPTSVSDIASQLISQYVASSQSVPAPFQAPAANAGMEQGQVESMQTDVVPRPAETTLPSSINT